MIRRFLLRQWEAFRKGDLILLLLCLVATAFGCLVIASATNTSGSMRYIIIQISTAVAGVLAYVVMSSIDTDAFSERRRWLVIFNIVLLLMLIPFGVTVSGNRSWLSFPFLPFNIQAAEICKISYILIMASVMASHQNQLSHVLSVGHMLLHLGLLFGVNWLISGDLGVSLIFAAIFVGMAWGGGVKWYWFVMAIGGLVLIFPVFWSVIGDYQRDRIAVLFDPSIDPNGTGVLYQTVRALRSLTGGGMTGQGLFQGNRTQTPSALFAQHTDFIYAVIGEEMGFIGCIFVLVLLFAIIVRCFWVGTRSPDLLRRVVCYGVASALTFQVLINVGMCIGVTPVIGLTLPFISYGGSSLVTLFAMLGLVSGIYARPTATSHERYIHPPVQYKG